MSIPKIIHYCWFGCKKKPELVEKCISSWKIHLKDYEFMEWNEDNFNINGFEFTKKAYEDKKWAFVSDYCRLWALYRYGGIYLDTDMEVIKPLDNLLEHSSFGGLEDYFIGFGIWGCNKYDKFISEVLKYYNNLNYDDYKDRSDELVIQIHLTLIAKYLGYKDSRNKVSYFYNEVAIYPKEYFYPKKHLWKETLITENTYTIHHYEGSWRKPNQILRSKCKNGIFKFIRGFK